MTHQTAKRKPRLAVIPGAYPTRARPTQGVFVRALVRAFAAEGSPPCVIAPRPAFFSNGSPEESDATLPVLRPRYLSLSNIRLGPLSSYRLTCRSFTRAALRALDALPAPPEAFYAHFLYPAGFAAAKAAGRLRRPAFVALGEGSFDTYLRHWGYDAARVLLHRFSGIVSLSEENRALCVVEYGIPNDRILLLPNAADQTRFRPRDRASARRALGLPAGRPLVLFVGHFNENKGPLRLLDALRSIPEAGAAFLGRGPQRPSGPQVLFAGEVPHDRVPEWMAAADLFALPTLRDCSPNAVAEAMACGLPIVASEIPSLVRMCHPDSAELVPPGDAPAFAAALRRVLEDPERRARMGAATLRRAQSHPLSARAQRILEWIADRTPLPDERETA